MSVGAGERQWTVLSEGGGSFVNFSSFQSISVDNGGNTLEYPIEEGSFASYNKVSSPLLSRVRLGVWGSEDDFNTVLEILTEYRDAAEVLTVVTPAYVYDSQTLDRFSYSRSNRSGAGCLIVDLYFVEVRNIDTTSSTGSLTQSNCENSTSCSNVRTGRTQAQPAQNDSVLYSKLGRL